ncbi:MAG: hypothetical protein MUC91_09960 [Verrucomicrobia bacterium]|nr:hypothetical protein [Verrucomicrobiota bacterium]
MATKRKAAGDAVELSFYGVPGSSYTLERTFELTGTETWAAQQTNIAGPDGGTVFTNIPVATSNDFWRIRSVP